MFEQPRTDTADSDYAVAILTETGALSTVDIGSGNSDDSVPMLNCETGVLSTVDIEGSNSNRRWLTGAGIRVIHLSI